MISFKKYKRIRDRKSVVISESLKPIGSRVILGDGNSYKPFYVSDDPKSEHFGKNRNLAPIVRAFKKGANWGWARNDSGEERPVKITGKKLYLTGGAVRDHLLNIKPRNVELVTNASPEEITKILTQNDFKYIRDSGVEVVSPKSFRVMKADAKNRPFAFKVTVNNDEFDLECLTKTPRGTNEDIVPGSLKDDAKGRDFTINAMYIVLSNDNGPNKELIDFFGGIHHLIQKKIVPIGNAKRKFEEDPKRIVRYVRFMSDYGNINNVNEEDILAAQEVGNKLLLEIPQRDKTLEVERFMEKPYSNVCKFITILDALNLAKHVFCNCNVDANFHEPLYSTDDNCMRLSWSLRNNPVSQLMGLEFSEQVMKKLLFYVLFLTLSENITPAMLEKLLVTFLNSGINTKNVKTWGIKVAKMNPNLVNAFVKYTKVPRITLHDLDGCCDNDYNYSNSNYMNYTTRDTLYPSQFNTFDTMELNNERRNKEWELFNNIYSQYNI